MSRAARRGDWSLAAPGRDAVLVRGQGSCLEVDRRRAQNGSGGGPRTGQGWDQRKGGGEEEPGL